MLGHVLRDSVLYHTVLGHCLKPRNVSWPPRCFPTLQKQVLHSPSKLDLPKPSGWCQSEDKAAGPPPGNTTKSGLTFVFHSPLPARGLVRCWCMPRSQIPTCSQVHTLLIAEQQRDVTCQVMLQVPGARIVSVFWIWGAKTLIGGHRYLWG